MFKAGYMIARLGKATIISVNQEDTCHISASRFRHFLWSYSSNGLALLSHIISFLIENSLANPVEESSLAGQSIPAVQNGLSDVSSDSIVRSASFSSCLVSTDATSSFDMSAPFIHGTSLAAYCGTRSIDIQRYRERQVGGWGAENAKTAPTSMQNNVRCNVFFEHRSAISMVSIFRGPGWRDVSHRGVRNVFSQRKIYINTEWQSSCASRFVGSVLASRFASKNGLYRGDFAWQS